jgi:hypothetical protein
VLRGIVAFSGAETNSNATGSGTCIPFRPSAPIAISGIFNDRTDHFLSFSDCLAKSFYAPLRSSGIEFAQFFFNKQETKIRRSFTLSCPQGVPSSGGPFLVLHNCGLDLCPHQRCVHGSLRANDRHRKYLIKIKSIIICEYCFD